MMKTIIGKFGRITAVAMLVVTVVAPATALSGQGGPAKAKSGVAWVLEFDADWTQNMPNGAVHPALCQTEAYLAGPNEDAVINMDGFIAPSGTAYEFLHLKVAVSEDGGPFAALPGSPALDGMLDGAAQVSITKKLQLVEGVTYVFGAQFQTGAPLVSGWSTCHGTVTIVRPTP